MAQINLCYFERQEHKDTKTQRYLNLAALHHGDFALKIYLSEII